METKGVTCKIPLDLHNRISEEIRETESTMSKFIEMVIREHYQKGEVNMTEKGKTLAFQVSGELFQRIKEYLVLYEKTYHRRLTQKEFVISLIEQAARKPQNAAIPMRMATRRIAKFRPQRMTPKESSHRSNSSPAGLRSSLSILRGCFHIIDLLPFERRDAG